MNAITAPARRFDFDLRAHVDMVLASSAAKVDKRAALIMAGLSYERAIALTA